MIRNKVCSIAHRSFFGFGGILETLISLIEEFFFWSIPSINSMLMSRGIRLYSSSKIWLVFAPTDVLLRPIRTIDVLFSWFSVTGFLEFHRFKDFISLYMRFWSFLLRNGSSSDFLINWSILAYSFVYWIRAEISVTVRSVSLVSLRWILVLERLFLIICCFCEPRVCEVASVTLWWMMLNFL